MRRTPEWEKVGGKSGYVFEERGECLLALDKQDEAKQWFAKAHKELSKDPWLKDNEPARLAPLKTLSE